MIIMVKMQWLQSVSTVASKRDNNHHAKPESFREEGRLPFRARLACLVHFKISKITSPISPFRHMDCPSISFGQTASP